MAPRSRTAAPPAANGAPAPAPARTKLAVPAPPPAPAQPVIRVPKPNIQIAFIEIIGDTPLISNTLSNKYMGEMEGERGKHGGVEAPADVPEAQGKKLKKAKSVRNYDQEYLDSLYPMDDGKGYGFPSISFKHALVEACRQVDDLEKVLAKQIIFVLDDGYSRGTGCVRIVGKPKKQRDAVRLDNISRTPDVRFRGVFMPWAATLQVQFNANILKVEDVFSLTQLAGFSVGVGENRPSSPRKTGPHGRWHLKGLEHK